jgi:hypothetical protein
MVWEMQGGRGEAGGARRKEKRMSGEQPEAEKRFCKDCVHLHEGKRGRLPAMCATGELVLDPVWGGIRLFVVSREKNEDFQCPDFVGKLAPLGGGKAGE